MCYRVSTVLLLSTSLVAPLVWRALFGGGPQLTVGRLPVWGVLMPVFISHSLSKAETKTITYGDPEVWRISTIYGQPTFEEGETTPVRPEAVLS